MNETIIRVFTNTVNISSKCAQALFDAQEYEYELWIKPEDVSRDHRLVFEPRYGGSLDWLAEKDHLTLVLKQHKVSGDINFIHLHDGNREKMFSVPETKFVSIWGYKFDGKGRMKETKGTIRWSTRSTRSRANR